MASAARPQLSPPEAPRKPAAPFADATRELLARAQRLILAFSHNIVALTIAYSLVVLPVSMAIAARRSLWFDEIYTVYLAHLTFPQLWKALLAAADQMPPLFDLVTRGMFGAFGQSAFVARIPSILAFWFGGLCVFRFVSFRTAPVWGFLAALLPFATASAYYASEARPYSFLVCFTALAMVAWQSAAAGHKRKLSLFLLALALFLAINSHYYAVLLVVPFLAGEAARAIQRRRLDWPVLACATLPFCFIAVFLPFIRNSERLLTDHAWNRPSLSSLYEPYPFVFGNSAAIIWAVLIACVPVFYFLRPSQEEQDLRRLLPPMHETVAALALALLPVPAFILAVTKVHMIYGRYVLELIVGVAILFGFACYLLGRTRVSFALTAASVISVFIIAAAVKETRNMPLATGGCPVVATSGPTRSWPVVIDDAKKFMRCYYYSSPEMKSRIVFVSGPKEAIAIGDGNSVLRLLLVGGQVFHMPVVPFDQFRTAHPQFYLEGTTEENIGNWIFDEYIRRGANIQVFKRSDMYIVTDRLRPGNSDAFSRSAFSVVPK